MPRYGLKLGIGETALADAAASLWRSGEFDFLELYIPKSTRIEEAGSWEWYDGPLILHGPHGADGFNFAAADLRDSNRAVLRLLDSLRKAMQPSRLILHPGWDGPESEFIRQIAWFRETLPALYGLLRLENKPLSAPGGRTCLGASPQDMARLLMVSGAGFCLDFRHAAAYAADVGRDWLDAADEFLRLRPDLFHIADGNVGERFDSHRHFGEGDIDWRQLVPLVEPEALLTIECRKDPALRLADFLRDRNYLCRLFGEG